MSKQKDDKPTRGERLRRLRKDKNLSLEEVHQRTKIHTQILRALEEDTVSEMAPAYVKGLLKIYCIFLGVDPKDFIEEYTQDESLKKDVSDVSSKTETQPPLVKPRISVIRDQFRLKPIIFVICLLVLAIAAFKFGKRISIRQSLRLKEVPVLGAIESEKPKIPSSASPITKPKLGIRAKEDCYLEVKVDGKTILKDVLKKGRFEFWEAEREIEFSLGNAGGVDIEANRKLLSPLGRRNQVIRNIKVTKEGLTVPK